MAETAVLELSTLSPAEIDEILFPLWAARWAAAETIYTVRRRIGASIFPGSIVDYGRGGPKPVAAYYGTSERYQAIGDGIRRGDAALVDALDRLDTANTAIAPFDAEFTRRGGWRRFILVGGGHLHRMGCSTVRPTTQSYLLAEASGLTDAEVVARYDYVACTHCFPDAPVRLAPTPESLGFCAGSGQAVRDVNGSLRLYSKWGACRVCGHNVSATSRLLARKHQVKG